MGHSGKHAWVKGVSEDCRELWHSQPMDRKQPHSCNHFSLCMKGALCTRKPKIWKLLGNLWNLWTLGPPQMLHFIWLGGRLSILNLCLIQSNFGTEDPSIILWKMLLKDSEWMTEQKMAASERDQKMSPQIHCFGILTILSWRELRNSRCWKGSWPFPFLSKSKAYISYEIGVLPTPFLSLETRSWCWDESVPTDFTRWPLSSINFTHIFTFPQFVASKKPNSFVQMVYKLSGLASSLRFLLLSYVVQSLSRVQLFATPWTAARQASLSFTISRNLFKLMSIESVMPSSHLILCSLLLLLLSVFPSIRVFSNELALRIR